MPNESKRKPVRKYELEKELLRQTLEYERKIINLECNVAELKLKLAKVESPPVIRTYRVVASQGVVTVIADLIQQDYSGNLEAWLDGVQVFFCREGEFTSWELIEKKVSK